MIILSCLRIPLVFFVSFVKIFVNVVVTLVARKTKILVTELGGLLYYLPVVTVFRPVSYA